MVDWSDNAVRATVVVAFLNIGLLGANMIKNANAPKTPVSSYEPSSGEMTAITEALSKRGVDNPNCIQLSSWQVLSEDNAAFTRELLTSGLARPCMTAGEKFKEVDTAFEVARIAGLDPGLIETNGALSFSCLRRKEVELIGRPSVNRETMTKDLQKLREAKEQAKLICITESLAKSGDDL